VIGDLLASVVVLLILEIIANLIGHIDKAVGLHDLGSP
jgi:hypothetical protein